MGDSLTKDFNVRRPLLQFVAATLRDQFAEAFADVEPQPKVGFTVMTAERFADLALEYGSDCGSPLVNIIEQVAGLVVVSESEQVKIVENLVGELGTITFVDWLSRPGSVSPIRVIHCLIPPQAKPEGWSGRTDVPQAFELSIAVEPPPSRDGEPGEIPLTRPIGSEGPTKALIMQGGGVKGLAYLGALEVLAGKYVFDWYIGTSAGAITAVFLAAGFTADEMITILREKKFRDFFDAKWYMLPFNLAVHHGLFHGKTFTDWVDDLLAKKLDSFVRVRLSHITQTQGNRVTLYASRKGKATLTFDSEASDADAAYATRCSMSIPFVFTPQLEQGIRTFDGGMRQNLPVQQVLKDHPGTEFIAMFLGAERYESDKNRWVTWDLYSLFLEPDDAEVVQKYKDRTVVIDTRPIGFLDFDMSDIEKDYLLACGRVGAHRLLDKDSEACAGAIRARDVLKRHVLEARAKRSNAGWLGFLAWVLLIAVAVGLYVGWGQAEWTARWVWSWLLQYVGYEVR